MKTIQREYKVYKFEELSQEAREKAMQNWNENEEYEWLSDDMNWKLEELLKKAKIDGKAKISYSLGYSQGDGAMFEGEFNWKKYRISISQSGHYYHYNSKDITIENEEGENFSDEVYEKFDELYVSICKELEKYGYDVIEQAESEENLKDMFDANDYTFLENGEMFNN